MTDHSKKFPLKPEFHFPSFISHVFPGGFPLSVFGLILLLFVGWLGYETVGREVKNNLSAQLQATLDANVVALKLWIETKRSDIKAWSNLPSIKKDILSLVEKTSKGNWNTEKLLQTQDLKMLRQYLRPVCEQYGYIGFVLMDQTGLQIAALLDEPIGKRMLIDRSDFFKQSLSGKTLVSLPFPGEVALPDTEGDWRTDYPTMFVSTPVHNEAGKIVAVFSFRIRPETEFTHILETSRTGQTGETYAFDASGTMISDSRFNGQLKETGLLPYQSHVSAILNIHLHDPSPKQVSKNRRVQVPREQQPLTLMAASATRGESGFDVEGYNNYQGVPVIGAWTWLPEYHFGLATEIHLDEAFKPLFTLRTAFLYLFVLLIISLLISFVLRTRQWSIERERTLAQKARRESDERTRSIIANATDGIITIDSKGIVESFNPAAESLFQYRAEEVIGKNVNMLMPEPYHSQHDSYLENYLRTGMATVIGAEREVLGKRKDGTTFPMELSVSEMNLEERRLFIGIARDITERKKAEEKLRASKEQMRKLYSHLQSVREEERTRIAREVHDELGQELTALKMDLSWLNKKIPLHNKPLVEKILMMNQTLETTIETVQRISGDLRPAILDVLGLAAAIEWQAQVFQKRTGIKYIFKAHPENITLDKDRSTDIFRIFQETLTNVTRHANASEIQIELNHTNGHVVLEIKDNGRGISDSEAQDANSLGLTGMRERAHLWRGEIQITGQPGNGTTVQLAIPCTKP